MEQLCSIFTLFGGIRPMARALGESPSTGHGVEARGAYSGANAGQSSGEGEAQGPRSPPNTSSFPLVALRLM
jgi:hypothetical protein